MSRLMKSMNENIDYRNISSFDADDRLPEFRKEKNEEEFVHDINVILAPIQKLLVADNLKATHGIILILGTPRSGTTLLNQMLVSRLNLGYPSNLMARFYEAPAVGAFLQRILIGGLIHKCRNYRNIHGTTKSIEGPHEFGYFWSRFLGVCKDVHEPDKAGMENVDLELLNRELNSIANTFDRSVLFKCLLCDFFIPVLKNLPNVFFIDIRRNLLDTACSCWRVREERLGSANKWWSLRPRSYKLLKGLPPAQQIIGQLLAIRHAIDRGLSEVDDRQKIIVHYKDLTLHPEHFIDVLLYKLNKNGIACKDIGLPISPLKPSNSIERINKHHLNELKTALAYQNN